VPAVTAEHVSPSKLLRPLSPLDGWQAAFDALPNVVAVTEIAFMAQLNLRVDPSGPAAGAVAKVLGSALPTQPCSSTRSGEYQLLWLGPDEWLILAPEGAGPELETALREAIGGEPGAVTDVSAQRTTLALSGCASRELLAKGCSIDLHPKVSPMGTCVQTLVAQTGIIIVARDETASDFLLVVRASFAQYFAAWLIDAGVELTGAC
jgi:sarcosine oxidase subunit gamma